MRKSIKVSEQNYLELESLLEPRETFDDVVGRLLHVFRTMRTVSDTLGPSHYLRGDRTDVTTKTASQD
jgi:hypothetical protein